MTIKDYFASELNLLLWLTFFTITFLLLRKLTDLFSLWAHARHIPGPPSPSFFYGHASPHLDLTGMLMKSHEKYGSIVKVWLSPTQLLVSIKDPSVINEVLVKAPDKLPLTGRVYRLAFGHSSFFVSSFHKVKKARETLAGELDGNLLEKANLLTDRVLDSVMERVGGVMEDGTLDCTMFSQHMAFSILGATLFGDAFFDWAKANVFEELLVKIAKDACFWASYSVIPFWKQGYWKYQKLCAKLKGLTQDILGQCCVNYKLFVQPKSHNNIICASPGANVKKSSSEEACPHWNLREDPCGNVMGVMFHGCLTTAALISNVLARLVMHPQIQEKIYAEVVKVRSQSIKQNKQDVSEMHLLLATVYESARLLPAGPLLQRCSLRGDLFLRNGMMFPAGAMVVAPIQLVQTDELNWGADAKQFNPYRFLSQNKKSSGVGISSKIAGAAGLSEEVEGNSYVLSDPFKNAAFLPFGSGVRACVGQKFAVLEIASIFASLIERYEIKLLPGSDIDPKPLMVNCVLQLVPSPKIVFVPRNA